MQKSIWIFGTIAGVVSAYVEYLYFSGQDVSLKALHISKILATVVCVAFALVLMKKLSGQLSIARTLFSGILVALVKAVIMIAAFTFLYYPNGEFYEARVAEAKQQAEIKFNEDKEIPKEELTRVIKRAQQDIEEQYQPFKYGLFAIIGIVLTGFVTSIIMAVFVSTNMMHQEE